MRRACRRWIAGLIVVSQFIFLVQPAHAFLPLLFGAGRIGAFVGAALPFGMRAGGYAARDPRIVSTVTALGRGLAQRMGTLGQSIASMPWAKTASYSGIAVVGGVGGAYGIVQGTNWVFSDDPESVTVQKEESVFGEPPSDPSALPRSSYSNDTAMIRNGPSSGFICMNSSCSDVRPYMVTTAPCPNETGSCSLFFPYNSKDVNSNFSGPAVSGEPFWRYTQRISLPVGGSDSGFGAFWVWMPPTGETEVPPPPGIGVIEAQMPIDEALAELSALPETDLDKPLNDVWLAGLANSVHMAGTLGGDRDSSIYWPWAPSHPLVTPSDISKVFAENPALARPLVRDLVESIAPEGASSVPLPVPSQYLPVDGVGPGYPPVIPGDPDGTQVDWGSDPNVGAPTLEEIPTAQMIIQPFLGLWPELQNGDFSVGQGECPVGRFAVFGGEHVMDSHCLLLEENRAAIGIAMALAWSILSLGIVLRA